MCSWRSGLSNGPGPGRGPPSMIHATRENVNRCLRNWQRQGIVDLDERWIIVQQRKALGAIAEYA